jgi:hypothetical protein
VLRVKRSLITAAIALLAVAAAPAGAGANDLFTLDADATSAGKLTVDAAGTAYVTWTRDGGASSEAAMYCRVPQGASACSPLLELPLPAASSGNPDPAAVFPVFGPGGALHAVAPRYIEDDVALWKSSDGGGSFAAPFAEANAYSDKTDPTSVVLRGTDFLSAAYNLGLGFGVAPAGGGAGGNFSFADPGPGGVAGASLGLEGSGNPVIAYWNISSAPYPVLYYRYKGAGSLTTEASWEGPLLVTNGYEPRLAGGPSGLVMAAQEYPDASSPYPTALRVRKFSGGGFGPPVTLVNDPDVSLFNGGAISQSPSGNVAVAWPGERSADGARVIRLFRSGDGGASFGPAVDVARTGGGLSIGDNTQLAITDSGAGWVTYRDGGVLRLADLNPIAGPPAKPAPPSTPPVVEKPADYSGKTKVADEKKAGDYDLTLRLPDQCVQSRQRFFAGVGKRKRRGLAKQLGGKIKFSKVVFIFDGKKLKTKEKKPFRYLIDPGAMKAGSTHVVKTKVTAILSKGDQTKQVKRTLKGSVKAC